MSKCIVCGKKVFEDRRCKECFFAEHDFMRGIKDLVIYVCKECKSVGFVEKTLRSEDIKDRISKKNVQVRKLSEALWTFLLEKDT